MPVVATSARTKEGITDLLQAIEAVVSGAFQTKKQTFIDLPKQNAEAIGQLSQLLSELNPALPNTRWLAMRLIEGDESVKKGVAEGVFSEVDTPEKQIRVLRIADEYHRLLGDSYRNDLVEAIYAKANALCRASVSTDFSARSFRIDRAIDRIVTHRLWGFPIMLLLLSAVLWITIIGALRFVYRMAIPFAKRRCYGFALSLVAQWLPYRWGVSGYSMGSIGNATPYEYLLSALHPTGRLWLPTACGLQP